MATVPQNPTLPKPDRTPMFAGLGGLFFLSGVGGLILQVLWMYRLGLVFGNAAYATAATLSAFFLGLALGGWYLGRAAARVRRPLATYGLLEIGIAASALLWLPGLDFYADHYSTANALLAGHRTALIAGKFVFSTSLLLLPTFLMGGTFPMLTHYVARDRLQLGRRGTLLYAVNTLGAALGALLAGFYLLPALGVGKAYLGAVGLLASVGAAALVLDRVAAPDPGRGAAPTDRPVSTASPPSPDARQAEPALPNRLIVTLAVASGFLTLSAETLWTRMFAQVLQNSVYSFSAILVVFLIALALGGVLAHALARTSWAPAGVMGVLLVAGALMVGLSPAVFDWVTSGLTYVAPRADWPAYLLAVFRMVTLVVLPPTVLMGAIFPFLLKASPGAGDEAGPLVGRLVLYNSLGAVIGPVIAGFVLLDLVGLWVAIKFLAVLYGAMALLVTSPWRAGGSLARTALPAIGLTIVIVLPSPPVVRLEPGEALRQVWQASDGVVSVVDREGNLQMRLDNYYALGDSRSWLVEQMQAHVPLMIHPKPSKALFLGLGTGLTAGAALAHDVDRVVAVELVPNVVRAARQYFSPWANGLFNDPRVEIVTDDARNYLLGSDERFDVIVGDLFTPWHAGTGSLYTKEHFQLAREQLAPGGLFAQWLPMYQLTRESFETIAATFASVFPHVTVWRADFSDSRASIALVGQPAGSRLDEAVLRRNSRYVTGNADSQEDHMATLFYVGDLTSMPTPFSGAGINTDDRRIVELRAPVLAQKAGAGQESFLVGQGLEDLLTSIGAVSRQNGDPYLSALPEGEARYAEAGQLYFEYLRRVSAQRDDDATALLDSIEVVAPRFAEIARSSGTGG
jgi:spermidine synthase